MPALDADPQVLMLVNETYASTETAQIRLHNVGQVNYSYSSSQASCQMRIYDDHGHTIDRGVCSDLHTVESIAPGQDVNYTAWGLTECVEDGPWYGGCAESEPVPEGAYHLRLRLCPTDEDGWPDEEGPCTRTGATIQVI